MLGVSQCQPGTATAKQGCSCLAAASPQPGRSGSSSGCGVCSRSDGTSRTSHRPSPYFRYVSSWGIQIGVLVAPILRICSCAVAPLHLRTCCLCLTTMARCIRPAVIYVFTLQAAVLAAVQAYLQFDDVSEWPGLHGLWSLGTWGNYSCNITESNCDAVCDSSCQVAQPSCVDKAASYAGTHAAACSDLCWWLWRV